MGEATEPYLESLDENAKLKAAIRWMKDVGILYHEPLRWLAEEQAKGTEEAILVISVLDEKWAEGETAFI